ncbi:hypothetical protein D3C80_1665020 [compost metagenome]
MTVSKKAVNNRKAAKLAEPMAYPFVRAFVVLPTASNLSVTSLMSAGSPDISAIPPALSTIGPSVSIVKMKLDVESIPMVATAIPNSPPIRSLFSLTIPLALPR